MHPDKIGPYLIDSKIGSGGMGNVYHGTHETSGQDAAIKVLPASMAREEGFVNRFSREIAALRKVSSPHIVRIYEDGQTPDGSYYFSMEYVDGETLTTLISRRRKIPWPEVIEISLQIASALKAAHDTGIVHRDLKPSNLMISQDGVVKLADFGVAHVFATTRLTRTGGVVGTAEYMSPEQARGQRATRLSDLYSLGAVMYAMLTGRPPFTGKSAADILHKQQYAQYDEPRHYVPDLPRLLEEFVCKLLEKKPGQRIPDAFVAIRQLTNIRSRIEFEEQARAGEQTEITRIPGTEHSVADDTTPTEDSTAAIEGLSRGPATIVRDAIRDDLQRQTQKSPIARFFDNTFVLVALLALVISAGFLLSRAQDPDPEEELAEAVEVLNGDPSRGWIRVRNEILEPLLAANALPDQRQKIQQLIRNVDHYEFSRGLQTVAAFDGTEDSEIERLIAQAFEIYAAGQVAEARQRLENVQHLLPEDDTFLRDFLQQTLSSWSDEESIAGRISLLSKILQQSEAPRGSVAAMRRRLAAAIQIYDDDATVADQVRQLKERLQALPPAPAEAENDPEVEHGPEVENDPDS